MPETYATVAEVLAAWPGLAKLPEADRQALVDEANAAVRNALRREILLGPRTEALSGSGRSRVWLSVTPIASVESVSIDGEDQDAQDGRAWTFDPWTGGLVRGDGRGDPRFAPKYPRGYRNVVVAYTAGHDPVPPPVRRAVALTAESIASAIAANGPYKSESLGDYSYTLAGSSASVPAFALDLLRPYAASPLG